MEFASRTAPKLESEPRGTDPLQSHQQILTSRLFTRETALTEEYHEQARL
jgi:hypothetical protein